MIGQTALQNGGGTLSRLAATLRRQSLELVFPRTCAACHAELDAGESDGRLLFCRACLDEFDLLTGSTCRRCGGPLPNPAPAGELESTGQSRTQAGCFRCGGRKIWFDETVAAGLYAGRLRELILAMKRSQGDPLSIAIGELLWQHCREPLETFKPDVIVPIPQHWRRRLAHRTNSAAVLAEVISRRLQVPLAERLLRRRRHTAKQAELSPPQRWENVKRAFSVRAAYHLREAHVLVVDDVLTTGATCSEAARALRKAGAKRVSVAVAARAIGN